MALVGQVATVAQLVGVDAFSLITMIADAAQTARRNRAVCRQLARRVEMIGGLLRRLHEQDDAPLLRHAETRGPVEALEEALRRAYLLVRSCQRRGYAYRCLMGARHADELREVQGEIGFYLQLFPLVGYVDATLDWARRRGNGKAASRDTCSLQEAPMECKVAGSQAALMPAQPIQQPWMEPSTVEQGRVGRTTYDVAWPRDTRFTFFQLSQGLGPSRHLRLSYCSPKCCRSACLRHSVFKAKEKGTRHG